MYLIEPEFVLPLLRPANIRHRRASAGSDGGEHRRESRVGGGTRSAYLCTAKAAGGGCNVIGWNLMANKTGWMT
jgi:hypothetical protein